MSNTNTDTLATMSEVVEYLTHNCGIKPGWAQAFVTEYMHHEQPQGDDHIWLIAQAGEIDEDAGARQVESVTTGQAWDLYADWLTYNIRETAEGIIFDGDLQYNHQGFYF